MFDFTPAQGNLLIVAYFFLVFATYVAPVLLLLLLIYILFRHFKQHKKIPIAVTIVTSVLGLLTLYYVFGVFVSNQIFKSNNSDYLNNFGFTTYLPKGFSVYAETNYYRKPPYLNWRYTLNKSAGGIPMIDAIEYKKGTSSSISNTSDFLDPPNKCDVEAANTILELGGVQSSGTNIACNLVAISSKGYKIYTPANNNPKAQRSYAVVVINDTIVSFEYDNLYTKDSISLIKSMVDSFTPVDPSSVKLNEAFN